MTALHVGWPQIIYLSLIFLSLGLHLGKHGESMGNYNFFVKLFDVCATLGLLYWGGFFGD